MTPDALTREDVVGVCLDFYGDLPTVEQRNVIVQLRDTDAALRATITQQAQEINKLKQEAVDTTNTHYDTISQIQQAARDAVKEDREQQAQELGRCKSEKNDAVIELYRKLDAKDAELAASQARCRELEREIKSLTTCGCEGCDDNLEESAFCLPCMNKVQKQVTQLQTTLAAREAEIDRLKLAQQHSIQDECEAEQRLIDAGISDYEDGGQGEYRGLLTQIDLCIKERDAAVQQLNELRGRLKDE